MIIPAMAAIKVIVFMEPSLCVHRFVQNNTAGRGMRATRQVQPSSLSAVSLFRPDLWPGVTREAEEERATDGTSAVNLKFLSVARHDRHRNFKFETALES
jgi:hypothetical protein